ncbi:MAG: hypothetical protein U1F16_16000 [Turneriella sp.]
MKSPFDGSEMKELQTGVFRDAAGGYLITDIATIRKNFDGRIQQLNTREMKLDTLGVFPLSKDALPLLEKKVSHAGNDLTIHPLLKNSRIPIYADSASVCAYIPAEGANICRYFHDLWRLDETNLQESEAVLAGFALLASYAGI